MNAKELHRNLICPRCMGYIPNAEFAGMYPGALSRTDNKTEICSECGQMEALEDYSGNGPLSQSHWMVQPK
jgi:hypothetical protein